jgi:fatty-acyl-CoA synthase
MTPSHACLAARNQDAAQETTAGDILIEWARRTPYRIALTEGGARGARPSRSWTCEALRDDAATLAVALLSRFPPGERIAVWAPPCPEGVLLQFAAAFAGLTLAMIDPACDAGELARILDHSGAAGLFILTGKAGRASARRAAKRVDALREVVDLADRRALFAKHRCVDGLPDVRPGDPAQIRYAASGSGPPRGETVPQGDLADALRGAISGRRPHGDTLLPYFPKDGQSGWAADFPAGPPRVGRVAAVA